MSQLPSEEEYNRVKEQYEQKARELEKKLGSNLVDLRNDLLPKYLKGKLLTACAVFGATYMGEELMFRDKVPGIVKFAGALSATVVAPKVYRKVFQRYFEMQPEPITPPAPSEESLSEI